MATPHNADILDKFKEYIDELDVKTDTYRIKQLTKALDVLKGIEYNINKENLEDLTKIKGIGEGTIRRLTEILDDMEADIENGDLHDDIDKKIEHKKDITERKSSRAQKSKAIKELSSIIGVGPANAKKFVEDGIYSVEDLKQKIKDGYKVNDKIKLGVKYVDNVLEVIPRSIINEVKNIIKANLEDLEEELKHTRYKFEICGSYRREKPTSGDIDVLITGTVDKSHRGYKKKQEELGYTTLHKLVEYLKDPQYYNDEKEFIVDDLTDKNYTTKYMGFCVYKNSKPMRIDIRYVEPDEFYSAVLYFTGSTKLNVEMRNKAIELGYKLSEYGVEDKKGKRFVVNSEKDIFDILDMKYIEPKDR